MCFRYGFKYLELLEKFCPDLDKYRGVAKISFFNGNPEDKPSPTLTQACLAYICALERSDNDPDKLEKVFDRFNCVMFFLKHGMTDMNEIKEIRRIYSYVSPLAVILDQFINHNK